MECRKLGILALVFEIWGRRTRPNHSQYNNTCIGVLFASYNTLLAANLSFVFSSYICRQ